MLTLLSQALLIEEELFEEQDEVYKSDFIKDFHEEQCFLREMKMTKIETENSCSKNNTFLEKSTFKSMYKKIAAKTHPDKKGGEEGLFKKVVEAYENSDVIKMMTIAREEDIDITIKEEELTQIEKDFEKRKENLAARKNTLRWVWGVSDKGDAIKSVIRQSMQIDEEIFLKWKNKKKEERD